MLPADLTCLCMLEVWHSQCSFGFCVVTWLAPNAKRQKVSVRHKSFTCQSQKYGLMHAVFLDHQFSMVLKFLCEFS